MGSYRKKENGLLALTENGICEHLCLNKVALQKQNDKLTQEKKILESSLNRYLRLYDFAPIGYFSICENGLIDEVNLMGAHLLSQARSAIINQYFIQFIAPQDGDTWHFFSQSLIKDGINKSCEVRMLRSDGTMFYALLECSVQKLLGQDCESREFEIKEEGIELVATSATINIFIALSDITKHKAFESKMNSLAFYDPLTCLPNRRLFNDRLIRAMSISARNKKYCALMFLDLDNFKLVNDTFGHDMGDFMLIIIARKLTSSIRKGDMVSRTGGDEFMVILENLNHNLQLASAQAEAVGKKILATMREPIQLGGHTHLGSVSIGITLFNGNSYNLPELQKQADIAMYQAKNEGRNKLIFLSSYQ